MTLTTPRYKIPYPENGDPIHLGASQMAELATTIDALMGEVADASAVDATNLPTANRIVKRDAAGRAQVATPSAPADISTKGYVDGGTYAVNTATANKIVKRDAAGRAQVATPSAPADISNKGYVDGQITARLGNLTLVTATAAPAAGTPATTITFVV